MRRNAFDGYRVAGTHMNKKLTRAEEEFVRELRWRRAAAWARGQSAGPEEGVQPAERRRIKAIHDRIREIGEDAAYTELFGGQTVAHTVARPRGTA